MKKWVIEESILLPSLAMISIWLSFHFFVLEDYVPNFSAKKTYLVVLLAFLSLAKPKRFQDFNFQDLKTTISFLRNPKKNENSRNELSQMGSNDSARSLLVLLLFATIRCLFIVV